MGQRASLYGAKSPPWWMSSKSLRGKKPPNYKGVILPPKLSLKYCPHSTTHKSAIVSFLCVCLYTGHQPWQLQPRKSLEQWHRPDQAGHSGPLHVQGFPCVSGWSGSPRRYKLCRHRLWKNPHRYYIRCNRESYSFQCKLICGVWTTGRNRIQMHCRGKSIFHAFIRLHQGCSGVEAWGSSIP